MTERSPELQVNPEITHNLNHEVFIKVTPRGEQIWEEYVTPIRIATKSPEALPLKRDEDGFTRMQLWEVMHVFGPHMHMGTDVPIETEFQFTKDRTFPE